MAAAVKDVLLVGFGAVGSIYALILKRSGLARVTVVARSNYESVKRDGMHIMSEKYGDIPSWQPDRLFPSVRDALDRPYSYVVVATKFLPGISPNSALLEPLLSASYPHPQPGYVLLQNGLGIETELHDAASKLSEKGHPKILSCTVYIGANLLSETVVQHSDYDRLTIGLYKPENQTEESKVPEEISLLEDIGGIFKAGGSDITLVPEIQSHRFKKNFWNLAFASFATLSGYPVRAIFQEPAVEGQVVPVIRAVMREKLAVGRAMGFDETALPSSIVEDIIASTGNIHRRLDSKHKASMLLDYEKGRPLEIEAIVGEVVRNARKLNVDVPRIETLYALLLIIQGQLLKKR
ncbi:6-phosphogluconate dehydrogenase C-terminal domain-like protein [Phellopilus nigrolimitatus]|nr:6-phosphogluconate dehydrogenase C-terminal domain-like protein [Phellopilus nigrolimitatus]